MSQKNLNARMISKHDTQAKWENVSDFIPYKGEIIVYDRDDNYSYERFKIGDGVTTINELPFAAIQPDWSQNDETANNYIENRTHYVVSVDEIMILPETALTRISEVQFALTTPLAAPLAPGMICTVMYNGAKYNCPVQVVEESGVPVNAFGNIGAVDGGEDTGEPFAFVEMPPDIASAEGVYAVVLVMSGEESATIEITAINEVVKTVDPKYLGDGKGPHKQLVTDADGNSHWEARTHWVEVGTVELLPTTTITADENGEMALTQPIGLEANKTYTVNWNGAEYTCAAAEINLGMMSAIALGNLPLIMESGDSGEPFVILEVPGGMDGMYAMVVSIEGLTEVVVSISHTGKQVHKLDKQFLPEYIYGAEKVEGVVLPETTVTGVGANFTINVPPTNQPVIGANHVVTWNGTTYNCEAVFDEYAADLAICRLGDQTSTPFSIYVLNANGVANMGGYFYVIHSDGAGDKTISIEINGEKINPIDMKFLPKELQEIDNKVDKTTTVNGKALSSNITLSASDVNAVPTSRTINGRSLYSNIRLQPSDVGAVPTSRTVNGKALSSNITLSANDVGALPDTTVIPSLEGLATETYVDEKVAGITGSVTSVNGKTGAVELVASDVGADAAGTAQAKIDGLYVKNGHQEGAIITGKHSLVNRYFPASGFLYSTYNNSAYYTVSLITPVINQNSGQWESNNTVQVIGSELKPGDIIFGTSTYFVLGDIKESSTDSRTFNDTRWRIVPSDLTYALVVGNGTDDNNCSNAHTIDWNGNAWYAGDVLVGGTSQEDAKVLATKEYVDEQMASAGSVSSVNGKTGEVVLSATDVNAVPTTRKVNGKALSSDITLSASDVNALPSTTVIPSIEGLATETYVDEKLASVTGSVSSVNGKTGAVELTAADVGALPSSTVIPSVEGLATESYVDEKVAGLVESAPETLNTLNELAAALGDDPNFATTVSTQIGNKVDKTTTVNGKALSSNITLSASDIGALPSTTIIPSLEGLATETYVDEKVAGKVNKTITINGKALSSNITLSASDVGADPAGTAQMKIDGLYIQNGTDNSLRTTWASEESSTYSAGKNSFSEGYVSKTSGDYSHAEGYASKAIGIASHAEGNNTIASGDYSHTEGENTVVSCTITGAAGATEYVCSSDAAIVGRFIYHGFRFNDMAKIVAVGENEEGDRVITVSKTLSQEELLNADATVYQGAASGYSSHAEGRYATASGTASHAEGKATIASGQAAHAEGEQANASGDISHAEGRSTVAIGNVSHAEGSYTIAAGTYSHAEGGGSGFYRSSILTGDANAVEYVCSNQVCAVGSLIRYKDQYAIVNAASLNEDGRYVVTLSNTLSTRALSDADVLVCNNGIASGQYAHVEGWGSVAAGYASHAEGESTSAHGRYTHTEGMGTQAIGTYSHAEGNSTTASGYSSHAEGSRTIASGSYSHAEGEGTLASGDRSHAEGRETVASSADQHVQGKFNIEDTAGTYAHIVGNGRLNSARSNAHTLDWQGNAWYAGDVYVGGTNQEEGSEKLLTQSEVNSIINELLAAILPTPTIEDAGKVLRVNEEGKYELVAPLTNEEIDDICGSTVQVSSEMVDEATGESYRLYVSNGELKMEKVV